MSRRFPSVLFIVGVATASLQPAIAVAVTPPWDPFFAQPSLVADTGVVAPVSTSSNRVFGVAAGDFDGDGFVDVVNGRTDGRVLFVKGNGDGTFQGPALLPWKQTTFNAWAFAAGDVNGDGRLDVVWGANAASSGCSVPGTGCTIDVTVNDGDVRVFYGNGNGTFQETAYFVSGVRHNAGTLIADVGTDAGSVAAGDIDGDLDVDIVVGAVDGSNSVVKVLRNNGGGAFGVETLISQPTATSGDAASPTYFPAVSTQNSPWGLAVGDADDDGDLDLFVGDRALYVYLYLNDGTGTLALKTPNDVLATRPNVYLRHDPAFRAAVGFTPSLAAGDVNGDGRADLLVGLHSGAQTPASNTVNDGLVVLDVSRGSGHTGFGALADLGTVARGVTVADVNADGHLDVLGAVFEGQVKLLRQLPPLDTDEDGVSDYVDNAPQDANAARLDMNTDGSINHSDQLDNDFDTSLGDPENGSTWQRLGDPADPDDDNDGVPDVDDNCRLVANAGQGDLDGDLRGNHCDALDDRDRDGDAVPDGPVPGDELYEEHLAAAIRWSEGETKFVLRIDALSRIFQNEFTQLQTDAAVLSPVEWAEKCWQNYGPGGGDPPDPCGTGEGTDAQTLTLPGGMEVPVSLVVIPRLLWTDAPVIDWINDRNGNPLLEIGQHGTYHPNNTPLGDWAGDPDKGHYACETCGFSLAEMFQLLKVGNDTLMGDYTNKWLVESGATAGSPRIDWTDAAHPLISYAAPFNTSDATAREAMAQLGLKAFSASQFEENPNSSTYGVHFADNPSSMERFGPSGMFHVSADWQIDPPDAAIADGDYSAADRADYEAFLASRTEVGGLNTWLIEEVEWSSRACNDLERLVDCNGSPNREDNTVYMPRWEAWLDVLDYVRTFPDSVVLTMGEVALARAYDNAPTVVNPGQADADHDGIGDVVDGAVLAAAEATVTRNASGVLSATLTNGSGAPIADQAVRFDFDADGDGADETYHGVTDADGVATAAVTATRQVGAASFSVAWDGVRVQASGGAAVTVADATTLVLDATNAASGQVTDSVTVGATLTDSDGAPLADHEIRFTVGSASDVATTDASGHAAATLVLQGPAGTPGLDASFAGAGLYGPSSDDAAFSVLKEDTNLTLADAVATRTTRATARATLREADGAGLAGKTIEFFVEERVGRRTVFTLIGSSQTNAAGVAALEVPTRFVSGSPRRIRAVFQADASFLGASGDAFVYRR